jgi:FkbM family methyltransferase
MCVTIYDGQKLFIDPCDYIGSMIYLYQDLDPSISWCINQYLEQGDIFVDVGANIGIESIPAAKLVGNTGQIHSFEPNTKINMLLHQSIDANALTNITLNSFAVSDIDGKIFLSVPTSSSGSATVTKTNLDKSQEITAIKLDSYSPLINRRIKLLKIDVEGHELAVLKGASQIFSQKLVDFCLCEIWHSPTTPFEENDSVKFLKSHGYEPFQVRKRFSMFPYIKSLANEKPLFESYDYLFKRI